MKTPVTCDGFRQRKRGVWLLVLTTFIILLWSIYVTKISYSKQNGHIRTKIIRLDYDTEIQRRKVLVSDMCKSANISLPRTADTLDRMIVYRTGRLAMCYVPKAGSTFWKRIFLALQRTENRFKKKKTRHWHHSIFEDQKWTVHSRKIDTLKDFETFDTRYYFLKKAKKLLFVRDPYSRLFSAYVDKFVLADFWDVFGKHIVSKYRNNPERLSSICGYDVTFREFLSYVLSSVEADIVSGADEHWFPIFKLCRPCAFEYDVIGKQESFTADREYILSTSGTRDIVPEIITDDEIAKKSISQSSILMEKKMKNLPIPCRNSTFLKNVLWKAFKMQGYIPENSNFPMRTVGTLSVSQFKEVAISSYNKHKPSKKEWNMRRRKAMVSVYKTISPNMMANVRIAFKFDFLLFGYELKPEDLYGNESYI